MKFIILFTAVAAVFLVNSPPAGSWSYPGLQATGDPVTSVDARTLALGGSSLASARGVTAVFYNPANLSFGNSRSLILGMRADYSSNALLDDRLYSSSILYSGPALGVMIPVGEFRLASGHRKELDRGFSHEHKVFSAGKADIHQLDVSGGLSRTILAAGLPAVGGVYTGVSINFLGSGVKWEEQSVKFESQRSVREINTDYSGNFVEFGAAYEFGREIAVAGVTWSPSYKRTSEWDHTLTEYQWDGVSWDEISETEIEGKREITMPAKLGAGIQYNFLGLDETMITADIKRIFWSKLRSTEKDKDSPEYGDTIKPGYRDTTRFSVGAEHYLTFSTALRLGFSFEPFYGDTAVDQVAFTGGAGVRVSDNLFIDTGCTLGIRTYKGDNPFSSEDATVSETHMIFMVSAEWLF